MVHTDAALRSAAAKHAAHRRAALYGSDATKAARDSLDRRLLDLVDPERVLPERERARRLLSARKAHFAELSYRALLARKRKAEG